jgi:Na+/proline symporter
MLITFVAIYLVVTVAIGSWAARRVRNSGDYVIAGRSVPLFMSTALVFASVYQMVQNSYKVTLVSAFAPLVLGLYWKRSTVDGALFAVVLGLATWVLMEILAPEALIPPQLVGMAFSFLGMVVGSLYGRQTPHSHAAHRRTH